ncbi:uncharacterized protein LOC132612990 [Lycium barbarum]|uniref:uncharacterized protein LOC132612990 n=1 Tax=Lycium barbarum TaxID=112863 RepID=UPI00293E6D76|nr:uncharacterized protein LOC132612990 [Lycium barbarum]
MVKVDVEIRPVGSPPFTWASFTQAFFKKFVPCCVRERRRAQFKGFCLGSMTVTDYETQFHPLSRHALIILHDEAARAKFIKREDYEEQVIKRTRFAPNIGTSSGGRWHHGGSHFRLPGGQFMQSSQAFVPRIALQSARGGSYGSRGDSQADRGGTHPNQGGGHGTTQTSSDRAHFYAFLGILEAEASDAVIIGTISVDLKVLDMVDFDTTILGMDYLSPYHAILDFHAKTVTLAIPGIPGLEWKGAYSHYLKSREEHEQPLRIVLGILKEKKLYAKFSKCKVWLSTVAFLGHVVTNDGIIVDLKKIEAFQDWIRPASVTEVQSFIGLAGYYRHFVERFLSIASPLTKLTKKEDITNCFVRLDILEPGIVPTCIEARSSLLERIRAQQIDDEKLCKTRDKVLQEEAKDAIIDSDGVFIIKVRICVPRVGDLTRLIMEEAHSSE